MCSPITDTCICHSICLFLFHRTYSHFALSFLYSRLVGSHLLKPTHAHPQSNKSIRNLWCVPKAPMYMNYITHLISFSRLYFLFSFSVGGLSRLQLWSRSARLPSNRQHRHELKQPIVIHCNTKSAIGNGQQMLDFFMPKVFPNIFRFWLEL